MGEMFTPDASEVEEEDDSGKRGTSSNFLLTFEGTDTMMKYLVA
jgi:hypothetical protein